MDRADPTARRRSTVRLGPAGRRVAAFIEQHPVAALASSAAELAAKADTSDATVVRTVQALGYNSLADLKKALVLATTQAATPAGDMQRTLAQMTQGAAAALDTVLRAHDDGLAALRRPEARDRLAEAAARLDRAGRIVVFGIGPSAGLAAYAAALLRRVGRRSRTLDRTGAMLADQLLDLAAGDALLVLAYGRLYREVEAVFAAARELGLPSVLVTERGEGRLADMAGTVLAVPRGRPGHVALHGATLVALESLVLALASAGPQRAVDSLERLAELRRMIAR